VDAWSLGARNAHPFQGWAPVGMLARLVMLRHNVNRYTAPEASAARGAIVRGD